MWGDDMSEGTGIEWASVPGYIGGTWNPLIAINENGDRGWRCEKVSPGCAHCYAETMNLAARFHGTGQPYTRAGGERVWDVLHESTLTKPLKWRNPHSTFVCDMSDLHGGWVPYEWIWRIYEVMRVGDRHVWQVLTKRPREARQYWEWAYKRARCVGNPPGLRIPEKLWMGTSIENNAVLHRIDELRSCPGTVHYLSIEPLLEPIRNLDLHGIDWVIVGGESGKDARPFNIEWARDIHVRCQAAGVPFFFKQPGTNAYLNGMRLIHKGKGGDLLSVPEYLRVRQFPKVVAA